MLILCAPPLVAATVYMVLGRIIRSLDAEHLSSMRTKRLTWVFVLNDVLCFCTQLGGAGVQVTGDANIMDIGKKVVLGGLIFSLLVFAFFVWIAVSFHVRLQRCPTPIILENPLLSWRQYMWALYCACFALMVRNLVRTIQFGSSPTSALNTSEAFIYVFDAFMILTTFVVLLVCHPGRLIKKARRIASTNRLSYPTAGADSVHVLLEEYKQT